MSENLQRKAGKREFLLIGAILLAAFLSFLWNSYCFSSPAESVEISIDGTVVQLLPLSTDQEFLVENGTGGENLIVIKDGEAWVSEATCPDKLCIRQGKISHDGEQVVCLPNRMIARIVGE